MKGKRIVFTGLAAALGAVTGLAAVLIPRLKPVPAEEREKRRRLLVNEKGRTLNAMITDFSEGKVCYTYEIFGVEYTAFQDVSALATLLPADPGTLIERPATLKYLASNPANSIVVCEEWSGLRFRPRSTAP